MSSAGTRRVVATALGVSVVLAAAKLIAVLASSASALLASTVHSLIEASCLGLLLLGTWHTPAAAGAPPARAPDGAPYFWSFVIAIPIYAMGGGIALYEGVERLARPQPIVTSAAGMLALAVAAAAGALVALMALREVRSSRPASDPLQAAIDRPDTAATIAVLVVAAASIAGNALALGGLLSVVNGGDQRSDPLAAIAVGLVMSAAAAFMAIEVKHLLIAAPGAAGGVQTSPEDSRSQEGPAATTGAPAPQVLETKSLPVKAAAEAGGPAPKPAITARQAPLKSRGKRRR